jgi:hypothetical protein
MIDFMEECKSRLVDAQKRVQITQTEMQSAQARYQAAVQEANSLQFMINAETARRHQQGVAVDTPKPEAVPPQEHAPQPPETNKTDLVRELLRQRPAGITPTEIWREVKSQMNHRAYLYSILGRLKDRDEVIVKRKKYFLRVVPKHAEDKDQSVVH